MSSTPTSDVPFEQVDSFPQQRGEGALAMIKFASSPAVHPITADTASQPLEYMP